MLKKSNLLLPIYNYCSLIVILILFVFPSAVYANQIEGCYKLAPDSRYRLSLEGNVGIETRQPIQGVFASMGDGTYALTLNIIDDYGYVYFRQFILRDDIQTSTIRGEVLHGHSNSGDEKVEIVWKIDATAFADPAVIPAQYKLASTDSDENGLPGAPMGTGIFSVFDIALDINLEPLSVDNNQIGGCHRFSDNSIATITAFDNTISYQTTIEGIMVSHGDGNYSAVIDNIVSPDGVFRFRNIRLTDDIHQQRIIGTGLYESPGQSELSFNVTWNIDSIPSWSGGTTEFQMASTDSDGDGHPGLTLGGVPGENEDGLSLDFNFIPLEVEPDARGEYDVGTIDYDKGLSTIHSDTNIRGSIWYPALTNNVGAALAPSLEPYPVIVFAHGDHSQADAYRPNDCSAITLDEADTSIGDELIQQQKGYAYIAERLASNGFIVVSLDFASTFRSTTQKNDSERAGLVLEHLGLLRSWNNGATGPSGLNFTGVIDLDNIGLAGHSRGGRVVVLTYEANKSLALHERYGINAIASIAPASPENGLSYTPVDVPHFVVMGSFDGDTGILGEKQIELDVDRSNRQAFASELLINQARHTEFNSVWTWDILNAWEYPLLREVLPTEVYYQGELFEVYSSYDVKPDSQFPECKAIRTNVRPENSITESKQQSIVRSSIMAFFRDALGEDDFSSVFAGSLPLKGTHNIDKSWQYHPEFTSYVDRFNDDAANNIGTLITPPDQISTETGKMSIVLDPLQYTAAIWAIDVTAKDVTEFNYLSFEARLSSTNPDQCTNDISVLIFDGINVDIKSMGDYGIGFTCAAVPVFPEILINQFLFGIVGFPFDDQGFIYDNGVQSYTDELTRMISKTIRIPLSEFDPTVDLTNVDSIAISVHPGEGVVTLDNIRFDR